MAPKSKKTVAFQCNKTLYPLKPWTLRGSTHFDRDSTVTFHRNNFFIISILQRLFRAISKCHRNLKKTAVFQCNETLYPLKPWTLRGLEAFWSRFNCNIIEITVFIVSIVQRLVRTISKCQRI